MAQGNWTDLTNSLSSANVARGPYAGIAPPNGGGTWTFGVVTLTAATGAFGMHANQADFDPLVNDSAQATGCVISAVLRRDSQADVGWTPFIFAALQGTSVTDEAYLLGLSDAEQSRLILRKGQFSTGIPDLTPNPTVNGNLLASVGTYPKGTYVHIELQVIVEPVGGTLLKVRVNDLDANPVTTPVWTTPVGMEGAGSSFTVPIVGFLDDDLQIATGSAPLAGGRAGIGMAVTTGGVGRRAFFDQVALARQT